MESAWRTHVEPRWGRVAVDDVRPTDLAAWLQELAGTMSRSRVATCRAALGHALTWAVRDGVIAASPLTGVRTPSRGSAAIGPKARATASPLESSLTGGVRVPSAAAVAAMVEQVGRSARAGEQRSRMLRLLASTGMRWGEAAGLRIGDVDLGAGRAVVRRTAVWLPAGGIDWQPPKGGEARRIALGADAAAVVKARVAEGAGAGELVAPGRSGGPMRSPGRGRWWAPAVAAVRASGVDVVEDMTPHDLRHFFATSALRAGVPVAVVARQLGHANPATTWGFYAGLIDDDLGEIGDLDLY